MLEYDDMQGLRVKNPGLSMAENTILIDNGHKLRVKAGDKKWYHVQGTCGFKEFQAIKPMSTMSMYLSRIYKCGLLYSLCVRTSFYACNIRWLAETGIRGIWIFFRVRS